MARSGRGDTANAPRESGAGLSTQLESAGSGAGRVDRFGSARVRLSGRCGCVRRSGRRAGAHNYLDSSFTETPTSIARESRPAVKLHPDDARALGIGDGAPVRMGNRRGEIRLHAEIFDGLQRGVAVVESIWPNRAFPGGAGVNTLLSADPGPPNGGMCVHDTAVWVAAE